MRPFEEGVRMPELPPASTGLAHADGPALTERDREVLRHLADGMSTARVAAVMSISTNTVRTRIRRLQRKLTVLERDQIVDVARGLGIV